MKLVRLYIENFGGLHQFELDFQPGLTVINAPNGYGKTTLAEFIRAMFYGFPRKAKQLDKSRRQKYAPWQGGKYGGNLIFEFEGNRYRLERTFGATPRGDTFGLIDLSTNRKSDRFTENIGLELFQLDADSFERSTYMPQLRDQGPLTTDNIQAKLSNLVEDSADLGNYDKAVATLRAARSGFVPYRGSGGTVAKAQNQVTLLRTELAGLTGKVCEEDDAKKSIEKLEQEIKAHKAQQDQIRLRLNGAMEHAAVAAAHREYRDLTEREQTVKQRLEKLRERYPLGIPGEEETAAAGRMVSRMEALKAQPDRDAEEEEAIRLIKDNAVFEEKMPTERELELCRSHIRNWQSLQTRIGSMGLSASETVQYERLRGLEESGTLDANRLDALEKLSRELTAKERERAQIVISGEDRERLEELKRYFAPGIPTEDEILLQRRNLKNADELDRKRAELARKGTQGLKNVPGIGAPAALLVLALGILAAGVLAFGTRSPGLLLLAVCLSTVMAVGGTVLLLRRRRIRADNEAEEQRHMEALGELEKQIRELEGKAGDFAARYTRTMPLFDALHEISGNWEQLRELASRIASSVQRRDNLSAEIERLRLTLSRELGQGDPDGIILELHLARDRFAQLQQQKQESDAAITLLREQSRAHRDAAEGFLALYFDEVPEARLDDLLAGLQQRISRYISARKTLELCRQRREQNERALAECGNELAAFFDRYLLPMPQQVRAELERIRDDRRDDEELTRQAEQLRQQIEVCRLLHEKELQKMTPVQPENPELLRREEIQVSGSVEALTGKLHEQKQQLRRIQQELDRIPGIRDELEFWQNRAAADQKKANLLDDTMVFLEKAREQLQNSYMGPLREAFLGYMQRLLGENAERILLTADFQVQLERCGQARELGFFSAGQNDTVMLCMRMALVDALFTAEKPFVILDDPFVNLDDNHTLQALELLRELAADRQIIYLVCNSSRSLDKI